MAAANLSKRNVSKKDDDAVLVAASSPLRKALTAGGEWTKDEVLPAIYWARQLTSLIIGLAFGVVGFTGAGALMGFAAIGSLLVYLYYSSFLGIDGEEMGQWDLLTEGGMPAFALFLVVWTTVYSTVHHQAA